jgi:tripartite-type tricarboxylate transporter receptor subunit TctC
MPASLQKPLALLAAALLSVASAASWAKAAAENWPAERPIRLLIPFPAGGATDIVGRTVAQKLTASLGQNVVVDNRPGAGGAIGAAAVAKAAPDGYTILLGTSSTHSIAPLVNRTLPYDTFTDFAPVAELARAPSVLVVGEKAPAKTASAFIAALKDNPGRYNYGSSGIGTYPHLVAELFKWRAGNLFVVHIPYRGTGMVIPDLVGGQITFLMDSVVSAQSHIQDGRLVPLAVTGATRAASLPEVPTFEEIGVSGMDVTSWFGIFMPAGTPDAIVQRLNREFNAIVQMPDVVERFERVGASPAGGSPEQFAKVYRDEHENWKAVIKRANITLE